MSLAFGIPDARGLRCAYHGWLFNANGDCLEQPFEDRTHPEARYKDKIKVTAYPVAELGGLVFAYLGPQPAPLLPRWDLLVRDDVDRVIEVHRLPCNWLQCMDNAVDPVHFEYLHAAFGNYQLKRQGLPPKMQFARHLKIEFDPFKYGINKRRLLEGEPEDCDDWVIGHPLLFPNILAVGNTVDGASLQFRVPIDDENTIQFAYRTTPRIEDSEPRPIAVKRSELFSENGNIVATTIPKQDMVGWVAQGTISDRTREHLASSDVGIILYRKMLSEQLERVEQGQEPTISVIRDESENTPWIDIHREQTGLTPFQVEYDNYFEVIQDLADIRG
jgi:5,5'-dehydrodivanillate O-demethylase